MYVREFVYRHPYREVFEQNLRRRENMISEGVFFFKIKKQDILCNIC